MTSTRWTVRPAALDDADALCRFLQALIPPRLLPFTIYQSDRLNQYVAAALLRSETGGLCFRILTNPGGARAGLAVWRPSADALFLNQLYVDPAHRGRGGARHLLLHGLTYDPARRIRLDVFEENQRARAWYGRLGFQTIARYTWLHTALPPATSARTDATVQGLDAADTAQGRFGFSEIRLTTRARSYTIGRIGSELFRVLDPLLLEDEDARQALVRLDPQRTLLCIGEIPAPYAGTRLTRSHRLEADAQAVRRALDPVLTTSTA